MNRYRLFVCGMAMLILFGSGCQSTRISDQQKTKQYEGMTPAQVTNAVDFRAGAWVTIVQDTVPFDGSFESGEGTANSRHIHVMHFLPQREAGVEWKQTRYIMRDGQLNERVTEGRVQDIDLVRQHRVLLPLQWTEGDITAVSSGVWVSDDVFRELTRTRTSTIYLDVIEAASRSTIGNAELQTSIGILRDYVREQSERVDADLATVEGDASVWPIRLNGEEVNVEVIKARNAYGELTVLNNEQNPLILAFDFSPTMEGIDGATSGMNTLRGLVGYRVTEITLKTTSENGSAP